MLFSVLQPKPKLMNGKYASLSKLLEIVHKSSLILLPLKYWSLFVNRTEIVKIKGKNIHNRGCYNLHVKLAPIDLTLVHSRQ